MKNHWLDRKKKCNQKWKRFEFISGYGVHFIMNDYTDAGLWAKMAGKKDKETLEKIEAEFEIFSKE